MEDYAGAWHMSRVVAACGVDCGVEVMRVQREEHRAAPVCVADTPVNISFYCNPPT